MYEIIFKTVEIYHELVCKLVQCLSKYKNIEMYILHFHYSKK